MKERPILFSAPMVRAILDGSKTQTRRAINWKRTKYQSIEERDDGTLWPWRETEDAQDYWYPCPYGNPGSRLWVRETWRIGAWDCETSGIAVDYRADSTARREWLNPFGNNDEAFERYWSQCISDCVVAGLETTVDGGYTWEPGHSPCRWRPSIHMPRWASRINLEITGVRVERLQDITAIDAMAEGVLEVAPHLKGCPACSEYRYAYEDLWKSINGPGSWDANPWVWVVEFKRAPKTLQVGV